MNKTMVYLNCLFLMMVIFWTGCSDADEQSRTEAGEFADLEELYRQAEQGDANAMERLAECYEKGRVVSQSLEEAAAWRAKAERAKAEEK